MALSPTGPLERAAAAARAEEPDDWESVSSSVKRRVRATVTPSRPVVVVGPDGATEQDEHGVPDLRPPGSARPAARGAAGGSPWLPSGST